MNKSPLLLFAATMLASVIADDDKECRNKVYFPAKEILIGLNKMMENMQPQYSNNFTDPSSGKTFEMRFSGFTGIIKPLPEQRSKSPENCESRSLIDDKLETLGYVNKSGSYYKFHEEGADWWTANRTCEEEGAHLVVLDSEEEAQLVADIFAKHTNLNNDYNSKIFIGVTDLEEEGVFVTVLGDQLGGTGYSKWRVGNPDDWNAVDKAGEDCVEMGRDQLLNDIHCSARLSFVCEA